MTTETQAQKNANVVKPASKAATRKTILAAQAKDVIGATPLDDLLQKAHSIPNDIPIGNLIQSLSTEKIALPPVNPAPHIHSVSDKHAWAIFLDENLISKYVKTLADGTTETENYLIGYQNGVTARKNETHFSQKENDPVSHRIIFQPEPYYVSYSFFYGFFYPTIRHLCLQTLYGKDYQKKNPKSLVCSGVNISTRRAILKKFEDKYTFGFSKKTELHALMHDYAARVIENVVEICEKLGSLPPLKSEQKTSGTERRN